LFFLNIVLGHTVNIKYEVEEVEPEFEYDVERDENVIKKYLIKSKMNGGKNGKNGKNSKSKNNKNSKSNDNNDINLTKSVKNRFLHLQNQTLKRVLLCANKKKADMNRVINCELNGVVLTANWDVLSYPPRGFTNNAKKQITNYLSNYTVYPLRDGTIVTLYYYNGWTLSTANGYDVGSLKWMSNITYMDALKESIDATNGDFESFIGSLDKTNCYTIGFSHSAYQPLVKKPTAWFISAISLFAINNLLQEGLPAVFYIDNDTCLPGQTEINLYDEFIGGSSDGANGGSSDGANEDNKEGSNVLTKEQKAAIYQQMCDNCANALTKYTKNLSSDDIFYGYIMRSDNHKYPDILMESTLLNFLRRSLYNLPRKREVDETNITSDNRSKYIALRAFLNPSTKYSFITIFPQYQSYYDSFNKEMGKIIKEVISELTERNINKKSKTSREIVDSIANKVEEAGISIKDEEITNIVMDFVRDPMYLEKYFTEF